MATVLIIFLWQLTVPFIQSSEVSPTRDALLSELLLLQQDYCGEVILCNDSRHVEPDYSELILPCCVPCSCLPSCQALDICCPNFKNAMLNASESRIKSGIRTTDHFNTYEELLHKDNRTDRINEVPIESNITKEGADSMKERLACIRPQVQRLQEMYLDSPAYLMIGDCPAEQSDTDLDELCKIGFDNVGLKNMLPVTSAASNMTYVNIHCLKCNENTTTEIQIKYWMPLITIQSWLFNNYQFFTNPEDIVSYLLKYKFFNGMKTGNIHFLPPNPELLHQCQLYDVISCNKTGLWDVYNKTTEQLCLSGHSMPVIRPIEGKKLLFRNVACLYCNQPDDVYGKLAILTQSICPSGPDTISGQTPRFNITINVPDLKPKTLKQEDKTTPLSSEYIDPTTALTLIKQTKTCPVGDIAILGTCRRILCPRGHYDQDGYCVPLYDTLSGINLHVKLEITPSQSIAPADRLDFAKILTSMVNSTLNETTSLQHHSLSVWYLPRSDTNPEEFYLLSIYMSGRGGISTFDQSIKEIKDFYNAMKSKSKLMHKTGSEVKLQIKFGYRVDFIGDKPICYILGGVSLTHLYTSGRTIHEAEPGMIISEANWCYRTVIIRRVDTEFVTENVLTIKGTSIQLYFDQFERNKLDYYVCLELLHEGTEKLTTELKTVRRTVAKGPAGADDTTDNTPWYSNQLFIIAICIVAMGILTFIFCKIKAKRFNKDLNRFQDTENPEAMNKREGTELHQVETPM